MKIYTPTFIVTEDHQVMVFQKKNPWWIKAIPYLIVLSTFFEIFFQTSLFGVVCKILCLGIYIFLTWIIGTDRSHIKGGWRILLIALAIPTLLSLYRTSLWAYYMLLLTYLILEIIVAQIMSYVPFLKIGLALLGIKISN
jgi:hypothetical protein